MAGERGGPPLARKRGVGVVAGALLEARGVGALNGDHVEADARDHDSPDRLARLDPASRTGPPAPRPAGGCRSLRSALRRSAALGNRCSRSASWLGGLVLLDRAVEARHRLLPGERRRHVGEDHEPGGDQRDGEDVERAAHRADDGGRRGRTGLFVPRGVRDFATPMSEPPSAADRVVPGRPRAGRPRAAALLGRARHLGDAALDPGALRGRGRHAYGRPRASRARTGT